MSENSDGPFERNDEDLWEKLNEAKGEERAQILDALGYNAFSRREYATAGVLAEQSALQSLEVERYPEAVMAMTNASYSWLLYGDEKESLRTGSEALEYVRQHGIDNVHGGLLLKLSKCFYSNNRKLEALELGKLSTSKFVSDAELHEAGHAMAHVGEILESNDQIFESINAYEMAIASIRKESFKNCCIDSITRLIELYILIEDYQSAFELFENTNSLELKLVDMPDMSRRFDLIGARLANEMGMHDLALMRSKKLLAKIAKTDDSKFVAPCLVEQARARLAMEDSKSGLQLLNRAIRVADMNGELESLRSVIFIAEKYLKVPEEFRSILRFVLGRRTIKESAQTLDLLELKVVETLIAEEKWEDAAKSLHLKLSSGITDQHILDFYVIRAKIARATKNTELFRVLVSKMTEVTLEQNLETERKLTQLIQLRFSETNDLNDNLLDMLNYRIEDKSRASRLFIEISMMSEFVSSKAPR
jgi:tetratricopeptide (TPR) repeat protein